MSCVAVSSQESVPPERKQRVNIIEIEAWYVAFGWRLFIWVGSHQRSGTQRAYQGVPEQSRGKQDAPVR
jgi:hypothetical protein